MKAERLKTLNKIDSLLAICKSCKKQDTRKSNYLKECSGCKTFEQLNICGLTMEGKSTTSRKRTKKEEIEFIVDEFKDGRYHGINKKLAKILNRSEAWICKKVKELIEEGLIKE